MLKKRYNLGTFIISFTPTPQCIAINQAINLAINRAFTVPGRENKFVYDPNYKECSGCWICARCRKAFLPAPIPTHQPECTLKGRVSYNHGDLLYIFGPNENPSRCSSPFDALTIQKLQEVKNKIF